MDWLKKLIGETNVSKIISKLTTKEYFDNYDRSSSDIQGDLKVTITPKSLSKIRMGKSSPLSADAYATAYAAALNMSISSTNGLKGEMNDEMMAAAEPVIKKAVEEAEREIRRKLGAMFVSLIDSHFEYERDRDRLVITILHKKEE